MATAKLQQVRITSAMANIFTANVGAMFTPNQLTAIFTPGRITWQRGCIERLYYGSGDDDLDNFIHNGKRRKFLVQYCTNFFN